MSKVEEKSTEIVINHLRNLENGDLRIAELATIADLHVTVVHEHMRSQGDFQIVTDLSSKMLAASLQAWVTEELVSDTGTFVSQLAEVALEQVDWSKVAASCVRADYDEPDAIAA